MAQWIVIEDGRRWEIVPIGRALNLLQTVKACREIGLDPNELGEALSGGLDGGAQMLGMALTVYAARVAAGEKLASVADANDFPMEAFSIEDDDEGANEEESDPTSPPEPADESAGHPTS